ncbi:MAG: protein kinase domain-containing protein, partial [Planctomycetota bacterium]
MDPIKPGSRIGDLDVGRRIGGGAFGEVFLAQDRLIQREVALKVVRVTQDEADPRDRDRVLKEARLAGRLRSPHIATLFGVHVLEGDRGWILEMEYLGGGSLEDLLKRQPRLPPGDALRIVRGMLHGLAAAHEADVVHGDVKPANVLFADDGTVKLVDFGLAHLVGEASLVASSAMGLVGTPVYMSPEVVMGARATALSDLWSTGVVLYRALTGRLPFSVVNLPDLFHTIQNAPPPPLPPDLPSALADLTMTCLEKDPRARPQSCREALAALEPTVIPRSLTPVPRTTAPLIARTPERARLHRAATDTANGCGQAVVVSGEAGVGKSFLLRELVDTTQAQGFRWIETTVTGLEGLLRPLLNDVRRALREYSAPDSTASTFGSAADLLVQLLSEDSPVALDSRQQTVWLLERALGGLAARQPLGIVLENAHLADEEGHELLLALAQRVAPHRVLVLIEYAEPADGRGVETLTKSEHVTHLPLGRLTAEDTARLLEAYAEGARLKPEVAEHIVRVAEGNPLFALELFRHLQETDAIVRENGTLAPGPAWEAVPLPRRLKELVAPRLRDLPEDQRAILDLAAVDGVRFDGEALAAAAEMPLLNVLRALQEVYRRTGLVAPRDQGWRFANTVFQEGIYQELAPDLRRVLHRRFAEHLEERAQREPVDPERLGVHWERAGDRRRAAPHLNAAAHQATRRQECMRAIDLARRSGLLPDGIDATTATEQADLLFALSGCLCDLGRDEEAMRLVDGVLEVADRVLRLRALVWREDVHMFARGAAAVDEAELKRAESELPELEELGRARYLLGLAAKYREDLAA